MDARTTQSIELMTRFAATTGVTSPGPSQRYLWTDAFAVCNFLGLERVTRDSLYGELALRLVDRVHHVLGQHRPDDGRAGWISGADTQHGEAHPTLGGLRIGKPLPERRADEPMDERLEWERDGQYFHYLTKWMHALDQVTRATGRSLFNTWARELAQSAHRAFTYTPRPGAPKRMYWKASIDLSRPLVGSMGQHDPLDGLVTYAQLEATGAEAPGPRLGEAIADFAAMVEPRALVSADPLGIGGLLVDAYRVAQLERQGARPFELVAALHEAALVGLRHYAAQPDLRLPASQRLAFRELGLAIGLATLEPATRWTGSGGAGAQLEQLSRYVPLRAQIEAFWLRPEHRGMPSWREHANINNVMLATSLAPDGFVTLRAAPR